MGDPFFGDKNRVQYPINICGYGFLTNSGSACNNLINSLTSDKNPSFVGTVDIPTKRHHLIFELSLAYSHTPSCPSGSYSGIYVRFSSGFEARILRK